MPAFILTSDWQSIPSSNYGRAFSVFKPDLRRIVFAESYTTPTSDVVGFDLADGKDACSIQPTAPLWLRVADGNGPCQVELDQ